MRQEVGDARPRPRRFIPLAWYVVISAARLGTIPARRPRRPVVEGTFGAKN
jgi:hypothetical protein